MRRRTAPVRAAPVRAGSVRAAPAAAVLAGVVVAIAALLAGCAGTGTGADAGAGDPSESMRSAAPCDSRSPAPDGCPPTAGQPGAASTGAERSDPSIGAAGALQNPQLSPSASAGERTDAQPVRVRIPAIGVDSGLESLARDSTGWIQPPVDFASAGWYRDGVVPGELGPAVIAGHIDSAIGPAVFYDLARLAPGDTAEVDLSDGSTATFRVDRSIQVPKSDFPTDEVYGPTPDAQLRLVTCGGAFDDASGHYVDNVVVFATRVAD